MDRYQKLYDKISALTSGGNEEEVIRLFEKLLSVTGVPEMIKADAFNDLAVLQYRKGNADLAFLNLMKTISIDQSHKEATENLRAIISDRNVDKPCRRLSQHSAVSEGSTNVPRSIERRSPMARTPERNGQWLCSICGAVAIQAVTKMDHTYHSCPNCHALFTPFIDQSVIYTENNGAAARNLSPPNWLRLFRMVAYSRKKIRKVLDFGCGEGQYRRFIDSAGFECLGIDKHTSLQLPDVEGEGIDAINAVEVIEHFSYDEQEPMFKEFHRILKRAGVVYVESSFENGQDLYSWEYLDPSIGHCFIHSDISLTILSERVGFSKYRINENCYVFEKN